MVCRVLAVDDEVKNLKLIRGFLGADYDVATAEDGLKAWEILQQPEREFDVILLDRMMPNLDGLGLTAKIKADAKFKHIPIVMQTAAAQKEQVAEGIRAGVYYYLTKPYEEEVLQSIVNAAAQDYAALKSVLEEVAKHQNILGMVERCHFSFSRLDEARSLTSYLANFFPDPARVTLGLTEMLVNAVEHGNLGLSYEDKSRLRREGGWEAEISRREALAEYAARRVRVDYERRDDEICLTIRDEGAGFNWEKYLELAPERATDPHGRGIALSRMMSFDRVEYRGAGNEVCCAVRYEKS